MGTVKCFKATKWLGFIEPDSGGKHMFVHISAWKGLDLARSLRALGVL
jgi:cold shock CspA family protein